ncbi:G-alpha-domain-containing protein [Dendrothele bispora CBS 962.96]|uniref:G-alpha-domain-containing protein n=1 Tax=Dendrothele bispora (strain CBS 962.96) TaxID=1314807 RepID=A0A4S8M0K8_DENBC|nr:G-alpha-domain-containing protein [Dendrothele bispora CBS 962.96]
MPSVEHDPFAEVLEPPRHESPHEKAMRERKEAEAKHVSDMIDEDIKQERARLKKERNVVKVLLLGQSESGKSTTLKNFRMTYARSEWEAEKASWRTVIQLNLIRSINAIMDTLQAEIDGEPIRADAIHSQTQSAATPLRSGKNNNENNDEEEVDKRRPGTSRSLTPTTEDTVDLDSGLLDDELINQLRTQVTQLKLRLAPLRRVESQLKHELGAGTEEVTESPTTKGTISGNGVQNDGSITGRHENGFSRRTSVQTERAIKGESIEMRVMSQSPIGESRTRQVRGDEFFVRGWRWREMLRTSGLVSGFSAVSGSGVASREDEDATEAIWRCKGDMKVLWTDEQVRGVLRKRGVILENNGGFFLDDIDRIATRSYEPSDDDVVRARLRTLGVQEHRIIFESLASQKGVLADPGREWIIYDVGGSRTVRRAWVPYFENITAILFLAPISCFDERLLEDSNVNRLEDSVTIWRAICSTKLLARTTMICFLNKCDILKRKLDAGVEFKTYVPAFGDRENNPGVVVKFLRNRFKDILNKHSPEKRATYIYPTTVTDTKTTAVTLTNVRDSVLHEHLKRAEFL